MKQKGFTLIELLSVIVVITILGTIIIPILVNVIEKTRKEGFKDSVMIAYNAIELKLIETKEKEVPDEGMEVKELNIKSNFKSGKFKKDENGKVIAYYITDGRYCAYGEINNLTIAKDCSKLDITPPIIDETKVVIERTTNKIKVNLLEGLGIDEESGIETYIVKLYKEEKEITKQEKKELGEVEFKGLTENSDYEIEVIVVSKNEMTARTRKEVRTLKIEIPTYEVSPSGWSTSKTVEINYPSGYTNEYSLDSGETWKEYTGAITFTSNRTIIARVSDGINYVVGSSQTISGVDNTKPTTSDFTYKRTSKTITIVATGIDSESGIIGYAFSKDNGSTWTSVQENNTYTYNNLSTGTYKIKVRVYNGTYVNGPTGNYLDSSSQDVTTTGISVPTYEVSPSGWAKSKSVTITYPSGYTNEYSIDSGITWKPYANPLTFTANGTIIARVSDGINYVVGSSQTVSQIDTTAPSTPTVTYNSGFSGAIWQNNINITLSSTDNSGILRYEVDWNSDSVVDITTGSNFIPPNGWNSGTTRFRAVDLVGNVSSWTGNYYIAMDTEAPKHTNWWWGTVNKDAAQLYIQVTDNIGNGVPSAPMTYNGHRTGVYCPTSTATGGYANWIWFEGVWDSAASAYKCTITPASFGHYGQVYQTHLYIYDYAGNGGYYSNTSVSIPAPYSITNLVKNGSFESGLTNWSTVYTGPISRVPSYVSGGYSGSYSIRFTPCASTSEDCVSMSTQNIGTPVVGHKYYGSVMLKTSSTFVSTGGPLPDMRFEMYAGESAGGAITFAHKNLSFASWNKLSNIVTYSGSAYNSSSWIIRNFHRSATEYSYNDDLIIVDLTATFGAGNEPTKEWCDQNINWFEGTTTIYK